MADVGRPTVMTQETIARLEDAFLNGASDKEACFHANISPQTLYSYQERNPEFTERKEQLKESLKLRAKLNIAKAITEGDKTLSQWYLERKAKDEFSPRSEVTGKEGTPLVPNNSKELEEITAKLNALHKGTGITGDGEPTSAVGTEVQN